MHDAELKELHTLALHWKSDLEFYRDELRFLVNTVGKYAALVITDKHINRVKEIEKRLSAAETMLNETEAKVNKHIGYLEDLVEGVLRVSETFFRVENVKLENEVAYFIDEMKNTKKDVFNASEDLFHAREVIELTAEKP